MWFVCMGEIRVQLRWSNTSQRHLVHLELRDLLKNTSLIKLLIKISIKCSSAFKEYDVWKYNSIRVYCIGLCVI